MNSNCCQRMYSNIQRRMKFYCGKSLVTQNDNRSTTTSIEKITKSYDLRPGSCRVIVSVDVTRSNSCGKMRICTCHRCCLYVFCKKKHRKNMYAFSRHTLVNTCTFRVRDGRWNAWKRKNGCKFHLRKILPTIVNGKLLQYARECLRAHL